MPEAPLPPGSTIGILGGGQLARMLAMAAGRLGLKTHVYCDEANAPAFEVSARHIIGSYEDEAALSAFAETVGVVTCEFENVPAKALEAAASAAPVFPAVKSFAVAQDRLAEKDFISGLGVAVAAYAAIGNLEELRAALARVKPPALLKTRRFGYDGKGQVLIGKNSEAESAWQTLRDMPSVLEGIVRFEREVSVLVVRGREGAMRFYDPVENAHQGGILAVSRVPAALSQSSAFEARRIAGAIATALQHVGVLCVEMFEREGESPALLVNEIAPRVHNSGHWTIDACLVSQFENHVRAICGWPLGDTGRHSDAIMTNLIGAEVEKWPELAAEHGAAVHLYGKAEARAGRKMGHVTRLYPKT
jgi:5-(carboxyamino)imidazole ribonucleotide synthase